MIKIIIAIFAVLVGAVIADGILLPSLFHIYGGLFGFVFLAAVVSVYGNETYIVILGSLAAFSLELWHGFYLGSLILSWLMAVVAWRALTAWLNIGPSIKDNDLSVKNLISLIGIGYLLTAVMSVSFLIIEKYLYRVPVSWATLGLTASSLTVWLVSGIGMALFVALLRLPGHRSLPASGKFYI